MTGCFFAVALSRQGCPFTVPAFFGVVAFFAMADLPCEVDESSAYEPTALSNLRTPLNGGRRSVGF